MINYNVTPLPSAILLPSLDTRKGRIIVPLTSVEYISEESVGQTGIIKLRGGAAIPITKEEYEDIETSYKNSDG